MPQKQVENRYFYEYRQDLNRGLGDGLSFQLFVERIEEAIAAENSSTLGVMATVSETKASGSSSNAMAGTAVIPTEHMDKPTETE